MNKKRFAAFTPLEIKRAPDEKAISLTGFTLIEVVIALVVLAIGLIGALTLFPIGIDAAARTVDLTKATFLAQTVMEEVKKEGYSGAVSGYTIDANPLYANFAYTVTVTDVSAGLKQVDVEVSWPVGAATPKSIVLSTFMADYEP